MYSQGRLELEGAAELSKAMNDGAIAPGDLPAGCFYTAAGPGAATARRIQQELPTRFPGVRPDLPPMSDDQEIVAYGYLQVSAAFKHPFFERKGSFTDSSGKRTEVQSFGSYQGHGGGNSVLQAQEQVQVLYSKSEEFQGSKAEFALDLCRDSQPVQVIIAQIEPAQTLAETLVSLDQRIAAWHKAAQDAAPSSTDDNATMERKRERLEELQYGESLEETLSVPALAWRIQHRFGEFEGRKITNPGPYNDWLLTRAQQMIDFRLDKNGVVLASDSLIVAARGVVRNPRSFVVTGPFLIVLKNRASGRPFFVMWVDNAELLAKAP